MSAPTLHPTDGYSLQDAASIIGISLNTLRKRIASGQVKAERVQRPQGHIWRVYLETEHPAIDPSDQDATLHAAEGSPTVQHPVAAGTLQAEAMAAYTRSILAPMVEALEHSQTRVAELERENGQLTERLALLIPSHSPPAWRQRRWVPALVLGAVLVLLAAGVMVWGR
jgi:hypothetical protein